MSTPPEIDQPDAPCYPFSQLSEIFETAAKIYADVKQYSAAARAQRLADAYRVVAEAESKQFPSKATSEHFR